MFLLYLIENFGGLLWETGAFVLLFVETVTVAGHRVVSPEKDGGYGDLIGHHHVRRCSMNLQLS
jgi:hypothetical protein